VWPKTRGRLWWIHKVANVLNKLPKSPHSKATALAMIFELTDEKNWCRLDDPNQLRKVILGVKSPTESRTSNRMLKRWTPSTTKIRR
jgi:hypothetical protein